VVEGILAIEKTGVPTYCCAISWAEIFAGVRPGEEAIAEAFFHARGEVVIDAVTGRRAGVYLSRYAKSHGSRSPTPSSARRRARLDSVCGP
jgi:hypothetical protein